MFENSIELIHLVRGAGSGNEATVTAYIYDETNRNPGRCTPLGSVNQIKFHPELRSLGCQCHHQAGLRDRVVHHLVELPVGFVVVGCVREYGARPNSL